MSRFVHLRTHSHYSLLQATAKVSDLIDTAKEHKMKAIALTDNGNLYGAIEFYKDCKDIKPIIGLDAYLAPRLAKETSQPIDKDRTRLLLLAKDLVGYKNLIKLVTDSHLIGYFHKPRTDYGMLEQYKEGLICIIPAFNSVFSRAMLENNIVQATEFVNKMKGIYGEENVYIEISHHKELKGHSERMRGIVKMAKELNVPIVGTCDVYYISPEDKAARNTMMDVQSDHAAKDKDEDITATYHFMSEEEALEAFSEFPEAIANTLVIADRCNWKIELGKWVFPKYIVESGKSYDDELRDITYKGLARRNLELTKEVEERVEFELKVIRDKGYAPYFLVVSDLLRFAYENGILTTIRGSVAGSLVTYLSGITNVNPLEYKLPFERFLNPERPSAPDIDMDYAENRREEMVAYAKRKYGDDKVAQIGTFGTMAARGSVRDIARALGYSYGIGDRISKLIPMGSQGFPMTIDKALEDTPELKKMYDTEPETKEIIDTAKRIEGCARHISVHAAGIVISPEPLTDFVPLQYDTKGENKIITQYDMYVMEDVGLLKYDFLGLDNLAILADAVARVKRIEGVTIDVEKIPVDDKKTFELLAAGQTEGLFQLNGTGMTRFLKELKPSTIHDINAMVALYRPGPLESIPTYIERKHNPSLVSYLDPRLEEIISRSYGVITYQDDVMMIAIKLAGYSWLEADKLRKAMGKKIPAEMEAQKGKLMEGFIKNGLSEEKAQQLWALIEPFAAYGFNKAHAASYGRVAYQTAYMKAHFPAIYMSAVLSSKSDNHEKVAAYAHECSRMKIPVLPPDVNESEQQFAVIKTPGEIDRIRFGLITIKNFGANCADTIVRERTQNGPYTSLGDFLARIKDRSLNRKSLESLIMAGALDRFADRGVMMAQVNELLEFNKHHAQQGEDQTSLFMGSANMHDISLKPFPPAPMDQKLTWEKELLGLYVSGHPLDTYRELFEKHDTSIAGVKTEPKEGWPVVVAGIIEDIRMIKTKKNDDMAFLKLQDLTGVMEVVVFPKVYQEYKQFIKTDTCVAMKGKLSLRNNEVGMLVERIKLLKK